jgi:hypothetical protein
MTRPDRDMFGTSRLYRLVPDRETLVATTERQEPLATIVDCAKGQINESESSQLVEMNTEGRVYQLPILQCRLRNYTLDKNKSDGMETGRKEDSILRLA